MTNHALETHAFPFSVYPLCYPFLKDGQISLQQGELEKPLHILNLFDHSHFPLIYKAEFIGQVRNGHSLFVPDQFLIYNAEQGVEYFTRRTYTRLGMQAVINRLSTYSRKQPNNNSLQHVFVVNANLKREPSADQIAETLLSSS
jgi:hypothetical protein